MENIIRYNESAKVFNEALPLGNGHIGAMVYGKTDKEKISLNHDTLWSGAPKTYVRKQAYDAYCKARTLVHEGNIPEAEKLIEEHFTGDIPQTYLPLGNLYIESLTEEYKNYERLLNFESGIACVSAGGENSIKREYFVSYPDSCMVIHLSSEKKTDYKIYMDSLMNNSISFEEGKLVMRGVCPEDNRLDIGSGSLLEKEKSVKFIAALFVRGNGSAEFNDGCIIIKDETEADIILSIETSFVSFKKLDESKYEKICTERLENLKKLSYEKIKKRHSEDVSRLYNRVKLDLCTEKSEKDTLSRLRSENFDKGLIELIFNFGRYLTIASSRKGTQATNLQGIWNENPKPPWCSNYTLNINTEMNYWPVLPSALDECYEPLIQLVKTISETGELTAKEFYHARGFVSHHNSDIWGHSYAGGNQKPGSSMYAFWNMSSGWLARSVYEYYEYTGDKEYLEKTAYPLMKKAAEFYLDIMKEYDGHFVVTPSASPENRFLLEGEEHGVTNYTTMSQSIVADLFMNIIEAGSVIGCDEEFRKELSEKLQHIVIFKVGSEGQLLEWDKEYEESDRKHRHLSHLYGLYPAELISVNTTPDLAEACRKTLEIRGDEATGWSLGWKILLWTRLKDGDRALKLMKNQLSYVENYDTIAAEGGGTYANLFGAHPPFQIDGNFAATAGVLQMLLQSDNGILEILPALPSAFKDGSVSGLRAKGGITADICWKNEKVQKVLLKADFDTLCKVKCNGEITEVHLEKGKAKEMLFRC